MDIQDRAAAVDRELRHSPRLHRTKSVLDRLLPAALLLILVVLYLLFIAPADHPLYPYRNVLQLTVLGYFVAELAVDFVIYEERRQFFRDRWLDIVLTLPFFTAFRSVNAAVRGLMGIKAAKAAKAGKAAKSGKAGKVVKAGKLQKGTKISQKLGKLLVKGKKLVKKTLTGKE